MNIKLGVIGLSSGNGHPYSWSAILNGYNPAAMELCGFPVIPRYLEKEQWPESRLPGAEVVSVWTQSIDLSHRIAEAALIPKVVQNLEDMIGDIDAVLLARDDAENHIKFAAPFLQAGLPVYIDKPIALSVCQMESIYEMEKYSGQIFTCSALRYSDELRITPDDCANIGAICQIVAFTPKSWDKYGVHIIEPVLNMLPDSDEPRNFTRIEAEPDRGRGLSVMWRSGIQSVFFATGEGASPLSIRVIGTKGFKDLYFSDSFSAFRNALRIFVSSVHERTVPSTKIFNRKVVEILERGRE
tara:strand:+ start:9719 stop:10615 length:897 start_codon:yes stop_codon:yes gene_type:complete